MLTAAVVVMQGCGGGGGMESGGPSGSSVSGSGGSLSPVVSMGLDTIGVGNRSGFRLFGANSADQAGGSISALGDFNNDGFDDIAIGAPMATTTLLQAGLVYVVFGKAVQSVNIALSTLNGSNGGFYLSGGTGDGLGGAISAAGDMNGDGFSDVVLGAPMNNLGQGEAYALFGQNSSLVSLNGFQPLNFNPVGGSYPSNNGLAMVAPATFGLRTGEAVSGGGDFNGDGYSDVATGMPLVDLNGGSAGNNHGQVYLIFGKPSGFTNVPLTAALTPAAGGINLNGGADNGQVGRSVVISGDLNGDNRADLVIGAPGVNTVYIVFGVSNPSNLDNLDLNTLNGSNGGVKIVGPANTGFASVVRGLGDINGDGKSDLIILAPTANPVPSSSSYSGAAYIILGASAGELQNINVSTLNGTNGFVVKGANKSPPSLMNYGGLEQADAAGDLDGDGYGDIVITQPLVTSGSEQVGETYIIYGQPGSYSNMNTMNLDTGLNGTNGFKIVGVAGGPDRNVSRVSGAGDINNDGFDDLMLATPNGGPTNAGMIYVLYGTQFR